MELLDTTHELLKQSKEPVTKIAEGAKVNSRWLRYFINGRYDDPGVLKVQRIHNYLKKDSVESSEDSSIDCRSRG